ncbi:sensor histidine kinase [Actinoplanes sp. NPDC049265]|uniref:sensor histidine kinase n=1 Tax=Actinoplanes sp. NPDC049265 TaxID=3363902 RepID=UPI003718F56B
MVARNALDALAQRPLGFLTSAWPWRSAGFLLASAAIGAGAALLAWILSWVWDRSGPLAVVVVLPPLVVLAWVVALYERRRLPLVIGTPAGRPLRRSPGRARDVGYGLVALLLLWWIDLGVLGVAAGLPLFLMAAPLQPTASTAVAWTVPVVGVVLLPIAAYPIATWAGVRAAMARAVLVPGDSELRQVIESRARLVDAFDVERRRIERDLHDGAQQRLVTLSMRLGVTALDLPPESPAAREVSAARDQVQLALSEIRELIHDIHPRVLADVGLAAAVRDVAGRSVVPVEVDIDLPVRPSAPVETTAYFVICEALTNVGRHSGATSARVHGRFGAGRLTIEIRDDGTGGATPDAGTGLVGIADRLAVLDGRMILHSPAGGPTVLRLEIPCDS